MITNVTCGGCGEPRGEDLAAAGGPDREPCPSCGSQAINVGVLLQESIKLTDQVTATMTPGSQSNDWLKRWKSLEARVTVVTGTLAGPMSGDAIAAAEREVLEFLGSCYHLKDILKADSVLPGQVVEDAITNDPRLALCCDLANLDKHHVLNRPPRSGDKPNYLEHKGTTGSGKAGWKVISALQHKGSVINAADAALDAMAAWHDFLMAQGLL